MRNVRRAAVRSSAWIDISSINSHSSRPNPDVFAATSRTLLLIPSACYRLLANWTGVNRHRAVETHRLRCALVVIPRDVNEVILRAERDELIRGKKRALYISSFEPAMFADELLLDAGVAKAGHKKNCDREQASAGVDSHVYSRSNTRMLLGLL